MPNLFAYFMLCAWPVIAYFIYRRTDSVTATFVTIVGGALLLPVNVSIDFPLIPAFDKQTIPALAALVYLIFVKKESISLLPKSKAPKILVITLIVSPFLTVVNNGEPYFNGAYWIQGMTLYDSVSVLIRQYLVLLPFVIASQIIKGEKDFYKICRLMAFSGLVYSVFVLIEVRLSPQLHTWLYGFFPHEFLQQIRFGGFRPVVFMGHGLLVGIFLFACFASACVLWKRRIVIIKQIPNFAVVGYLFFILLISKAVGSILFGLIILALCLIGNRQFVKLSARLTLSSAVCYPLLSTFSFIPHANIVNFFYQFSPDRARSLAFRFYHENLLLEHAQNKFLFGWGSWGRNRLAESITDGRWIIEFGQFGFIGFIAIFGLLAYTIVHLLNSIKRLVDVSALSYAIFALTLAFLIVDQIVNASLSTWIWLLFGSCYFSLPKKELYDRAVTEGYYRQANMLWNNK